MEEDNKKKKNKKKKNRQHKAAENPAADGPAAFLVSPPAHNHHVTESGKTSTGLVDHIPDAQEDNTMLMNSDRESYIPKDTHCAILEEQILQLEKEKDAYVQKVDALEKKIEQMQIEKEAHMQKESALECKVGQLLSDKESWFHKEAHFEEKIKHLMDEAATLSLRKVSLEELVKHMERERDSLILQENSSKEIVAKLNGDNSRLKSQVVELEEVRNTLLKENHLLTESTTALQSQILNLERTAVVSLSSSERKMHTTEIGHLASETEAAHALVEKLLTENTQLVGKVNELYVELDHNGLQQETSAEMAKSVHVADTTAVGLHPRGEATEMQKSLASDSMYETSAKMLVPDIRVQSQEGCVRGDLDYQKTMLFSDSSEIIETDEIVQIPLEENENKPIDVEAVNIAQKTEIPISDAPLIGAPFRLISFVARYVSGADLVEKSSVNSAR